MMKRNRKFGLFAIALAALVVATATPANAQATCHAFPQVWWWGEIDHAMVVRTVNRRYGGNWASYLVKLEKRLSLVRTAYERGRSVTIKRKGDQIGVLKGRNLGVYVERMRDRVAVTYCLALEKVSQRPPLKRSDHDRPERG